MTRQYRAPLALLIAAVCALSAPARDRGQNGAFSRAAWLAEASRSVHISSGVLPYAPPRVGVPRTSVAPLGEPPSRLVSPLVRVSSDLLPPASVAQPETQAEPYLAVDPENPAHLLAGYQESRFADGGARTLAYAVSFDSGATWTEGLVPNLTVASGGTWDRASDPWVAFGPGGRAYFASLVFNRRSPDNGVAVSASDDGGLTWSSPVVVEQSLVPFNDKEAMVVDTYPNSAHYGTVYAAWDVNVRRNNETLQRLVVARSTDGGRTWSEPVVVRKKVENVGVIPRVGPDGTVYLVWTGTSEGSETERVLFSKSRDGGATWTKAKRLDRLRARGAQEFRSGEFLASFDIDRETGALHVAWPDSRWTGTDQVTLVSSTDGGATWSAPARVSDGPDDAAAFTTSVAACGGAVAVSYYTLRNDPERRFFVDVYTNVSHDGGATFAVGERVTPESFDGRFAARAGGALFLGDYAGLAAAPGVFYTLFIATLRASEVDPSVRQPDAFSSRRTDD